MLKRLLPTLYLLLSIACASAPPATTPPPSMAAFAVVVTDSVTGQPIPGANVSIRRGNAAGEVAAGQVNADGYASWPLPLGEYLLSVRADGYMLAGDLVDLEGNDQIAEQLLAIAPTPVPPSPAVARESVVPLHVDGSIFKRADGTAWRWKLSSMFYALRRWDRGEDLSGLVAWTHQVGSNGWRVFCQYLYSDPQNPLKPGDISPARIAEFVDWAATQHLYIELTVLTDTQPDAFNMPLDAAIGRVRDVLAAVAGKPVFVEIENEPFKNGNQTTAIVDALGLRDQANRRGVLMATGDYTIVGNEASFFALDYVGDHPERKDDWPAEAGKTGHFVYDGWAADANSPGWRGFKGQNVAIVSDEPIGAAEVSVSGRRDANPDNWEDSGGGFGIGAAGGTFHSDYGSLVALNTPGSVPGPVQTEDATRFFAAMDFFPADTFSCAYTHDSLAAHPLTPSTAATEIAARVCGSTSYVVAAQPTAAWTAVPQNGWHITKSAGHRQNLLTLDR